jgi:hypothetical protein
LTSLPVTADELLMNNGFHHRNVDFPFPEPPATLNKRAHELVSVER